MGDWPICAPARSSWPRSGARRFDIADPVDITFR
jgi:hypothetical protein